MAFRITNRTDPSCTSIPSDISTVFTSTPMRRAATTIRANTILCRDKIITPVHLDINVIIKMDRGIVGGGEGS